MALRCKHKVNGPERNTFEYAHCIPQYTERKNDTLSAREEPVEWEGYP